MDIVVTNVTSKLLSRKRDLKCDEQNQDRGEKKQLTKLKDENNHLSA